MKTTAVIDLAFGDSGKGVVTKWLVEKSINSGGNPIVARFSGGPQAAHTIKLGYLTHICSSFGAGTLNGVPTLYCNSVYVDPICLLNEYEVLLTKKVSDPTIYIINDFYNRVILPWDVFEGRKDKKVLKDGTCGKGIYNTFKRSETKPVIFQNFFKTEKDWETEMSNIFDIIENYYGYNLNDEEIKNNVTEWIRKFEGSIRKIKSLGIVKMVPTDYIDNHFDEIIYEGSQGLLLDMDNGFAPNVTPSKTGLNGIPKNSLKGLNVYLVTRSYLTRHGNGYIPKESRDIEYIGETNVYNEYQGNFKIGLLEPELLSSAISRHRLDNYKSAKFNLVITHCDNPDSEYSHLTDDGKITIVLNKFIEKWSIKDLKDYLSRFIGLEKVFKCTSMENDIKEVK